MPLWNIVLSGYPGSGKTMVASRLISENSNFVRLSVDDLRKMFLGSSEPTTDEEFVYASLASLRDLALRRGHSVILDCTAPKNSTREFLLRTKVEGVVRLLIIIIVSKDELERRNRKRGMVGVVEAWDKTWEQPAPTMPVMKFRNDTRTDFDTSYYVLSELLRSKVHPYRRSFLANIFPEI